MRVYSVHQPPLKRYETEPDPLRFAFVRDGFSFWAFLFGPLWMLRHRMWLVLIGYVLVVVALGAAMRVVGATGGAIVAAGLLLQMLVGMEAGTLRRFTLGRRKFRLLGVIAASDREAAERRFFDSWVASAALVPPSRHGLAASEPMARRPAPSSEIIGLFPQAGSSR